MIFCGIIYAMDNLFKDLSHKDVSQAIDDEDTEVRIGAGVYIIRTIMVSPIIFTVMILGGINTVMEMFTNNNIINKINNIRKNRNLGNIGNIKTDKTDNDSDKDSYKDSNNESNNESKDDGNKTPYSKLKQFINDTNIFLEAIFFAVFDYTSNIQLNRGHKINDF